MSSRESSTKSNLLTYFILVCSGLLYAVALKYFVLPSKVILTGTEGVAASISYFIGKYWIFILLYSIFQTCLLCFAFFKISKRFAIRSFVVVVTVILSLLILPELFFAKPEPENERILLVIFGGILAGLSKALAFRQRGSTGDEDVLGAYFAMKYLKPVGFVSIIAATISTLFGLTLSFISVPQLEPAINTLMYTSIYIFVSAETLNNFYKKFQISMVTVITKKPEEVGNSIKMKTQHRTYTLDQGQGGHSKENFWIMRTIITHEELSEVTQAIREGDPTSFYFFHDIDGVSSNYYIEPIG